MSNSSFDIEITKTTNSKLASFDPENLQFGHTFSDHMFIADYSDGKWHSARIVPYGDIALSPANSMIHYGQSIFEGMKAFRDVNSDDILVFRPEMNAQRLYKSAERLCMAPVPEELFMAGVNELLKVDADWIPTTPNSSMYIRPFEFAMDPFLGVKASDNYRFMVILSPSGSYYSKDVKVKVERDYTRAALGGVGFAKTAGNYAASLLPAQIAREEGFDQLIWTDGKSHEYIEESGTMNLMVVINGKLLTSPLTSTILPGVTRDSVLTVAREWNMEVEERPVAVAEIKEALENGTLSEAFGVGTAATVAHIAEISIDGNNYILPNSADREFSNKVNQHLDDLKRGRIADDRNWIVRV